MLSYKVFEKFVRMVLEGCATTKPAADVPLATLFEQVRETAYKADATDPRRTQMAGLTMRVFSVWRTYLRVVDGGQAPTEADLRDITYGEWAEAMHTVYWRMPHIDHLHLECIAVTLAAMLMHTGSRAIRLLQTTVGATPSGQLDRATVYAVMRAARTRHAARDLCTQLLTTSAAAPAAAPAVVVPDADSGQEGSTQTGSPSEETGSAQTGSASVQTGSAPGGGSADSSCLQPSTPESERICAYLLRLDLSDDERE